MEGRGADFFRQLAFCATILGASCAASAAFAQESKEEARALQREISRHYEALVKSETQLSAAGCTTACRALGSMQRATARLCVLDPGPPCAEAQKKTAEAEARVRDACPECAAEGLRKDEKPGQAVKKAQDVDREPAREESKPSVQSEANRPPAPAPAAEPASAPRRGGCAGCVTAPSGAAPGAFAALLVGLGLWLRRRGGAASAASRSSSGAARQARRHPRA